MNESSERLESILVNSIEITSASDRQKFIEKQCAGDVRLLREVERLVANHFEAGSFLESPPVAIEMTAALTMEDDAVGSQIGPYRIRERIGEGGMGVVYVAEQERPVRRFVALKIIKPGMDSREVIARFSAERQALALMDHPHIAKVHDAGTMHAGRPYFVMELVRGVPITSHCDQRKLATRDRLLLFVKVCQAIQHAHQKGIIHRDIKPSNILVTMHDDLPVPKVIDFGIAKAVSQSLTDETIYTRFTQLLGTPLYMSPEQAEMNALDVDTRSDVYSLGTLLYELLTGNTPFDSDKLHKAGLDEVRRMIREDEPLRPSRRLTTLDAAAASTASQNRGVDRRQLNHMLRRELDWIVMKTLEKDRTRRYESASALAADVHRYLNDEPVDACPPTTVYRLSKFARRNRVALSTFGLVAFALLIGTAVSTWQALDARAARSIADQQRQRVNTHFELAHEAVFNLVNRMASEPRLKKSDFHELRKEMLTKAADFYDRLAKQRENDALLQSHQAQAHALLGSLQSEMGDHQAARISKERALEIAARLVKLDPLFRIQLAERHHGLAVTFLNLHEHAKAAVEFQKSIDLLKVLADESPDHAAYREELAADYSNLGVVYSKIGKQSEAENVFEAAIEIQSRLAERFPKQPDYLRVLAAAHDNLAQLFMSQGKYEQAEAKCREALATWAALAQQHSDSAIVQEGKALSHILHGRILKELHKESEAESDFLIALQVMTSLSNSFPLVPNYQRLQAQSVYNLGEIHQQKRDYPAAEEEFRMAVNVLGTLAKNFPTEPHFAEGLAEAHNKLADVLRAQEKLTEAETQFREGLAVGQRLVKDFPEIAAYPKGLAASCFNFGNFLRDHGNQSAEALEWYGKAIEGFTSAHQDDPQTMRARLRDAHWNRAGLLTDLQRYADALSEWDRAIEFDSGDERFFFRVQRSLCLLRMEPAKGEPELLRLMDDIPQPGTSVQPAAFYDLACAFSLCAAAKTDEAERNRFADRAMEQLKRAKLEGFFSSAQDLTAMSEDSDFAPIRDREDFQRFVSEVAAELSAQ